MIQDGPASGSPSVGDVVEVCPYRRLHRLSLEPLGRLDGASAELLGIVCMGHGYIAGIKVRSKDKQKSGIWRVPLTCLKNPSIDNPTGENK